MPAMNEEAVDVSVRYGVEPEATAQQLATVDLDSGEAHEYGNVQVGTVRVPGKSRRTHPPS
jgi:hypothetical protein